MKIRSVLFLFSLFSVLLMSGCIERESENLNTTFSYALDGDYVDDLESGVVYTDGILIIGDFFICLEKMEVGHFEISTESGNTFIDKDRWRSDYQYGLQGYFEITNITTHREFQFIDGFFECTVYNKENPEEKREYSKGSFKNMLVERSSEQLSIGHIQIATEEITLKRYICDVLFNNDYDQFSGSFYGGHKLEIHIPTATVPGVYNLTYGNTLPPTEWRFRFYNATEKKYYSLPINHEETGWPMITIEASDYNSNYVRGTVSGYMSTQHDLSDIINLKNASFEFNW